MFLQYYLISSQILTQIDRYFKDSVIINLILFESYAYWYKLFDILRFLLETRKSLIESKRPSRPNTSNMALNSMIKETLDFFLDPEGAPDHH